MDWTTPKCYSSYTIHTRHQGHQPSALTNWAISPPLPLSLSLSLSLWRRGVPECSATYWLHSRETSAVVFTDVSGNEPHRQVGVGRVVTSGSLGGVMVCTLTQIVRDVDSIPALGAIFPIFTLLTLVVMTIMYVQVMYCVVVEPTLCMHVYVHRL